MRLKTLGTWVTAVVLGAAAIRAGAASPEVWFGGGNTWPAITQPEHAEDWTFVREHAEGFYANNFNMRHKTPAEADALVEKLKAIRTAMKSDKLFYETDLEYASNAEDQTNLDLFEKAGFKVVATTINRGTNEQRTATLTRSGTIPLYYMVGPWALHGDINDPRNAAIRAQILKCAGGAVDGPVTMWRKNAGHMHEAVYSLIRFCHQHHKKFLYLLAPNESGADFQKNSQQLVKDMETHQVMPDIWAVSFYGPASFRKHLPTLPEANADGSAANTFAGVAYWLMHHLRGQSTGQ